MSRSRTRRKSYARALEWEAQHRGPFTKAPERDVLIGRDGWELSMLDVFRLGLGRRYRRWS